MRRKLPLGVLVILVLAVVSLPAASASSSQVGSSAADDDGVEVIRVIAKIVSEKFLDLDHSGGAPTLGDQFVSNSDLFKDNNKIGFEGRFCTLVREPGLYQCVGTSSLPRGQLTARGLFDAAQSSGRVAITGGTRRYRTAHGELRVMQIQAGTSRFTFRIIR